MFVLGFEHFTYMKKQQNFKLSSAAKYRAKVCAWTYDRLGMYILETQIVTKHSFVSIIGLP